MAVMISKSEPNPPPCRVFEEDVDLVQSVTDGSIDAWHNLLSSYSGLIYSVIKRHLPFEGEDDVRTVYVDTLKRLYENDLVKFSGYVSLSTWLILVVRRKALDHRRSLYGRYREPAGFKNLNEFDQRVFKLYYLEKFNLDIVIHSLNCNGDSVGIDDVLESIQRIENEVDRRYLNKLDNEPHAGRSRSPQGRLLQYVIQMKLDYESHSKTSSPDEILIKNEQHEITERLRKIVAKLPAEERKVINLKFNRGLPAKKISEKLNLDGQRKVYTIINRALRNLRKSL